MCFPRQRPASGNQTRGVNRESVGGNEGAGGDAANGNEQVILFREMELNLALVVMYFMYWVLKVVFLIFSIILLLIVIYKVFTTKLGEDSPSKDGITPN